MSIITPHIARERILVFGNAGCGKSKGALDIAHAIDSKVHVIDNDRAWERMLEGKDQGVIDRVNILDVRREAGQTDRHPWQVMLEATKNLGRAMDPDDWLVVDMATVAWTWVQSWFSEEVYGKELDNFFVEARKRQVDAGKKGGSAFEGMADWPTINRTYDHFNDAVLNARGHVYLICEMGDLWGNEDASVANTYTALGGRPRGNKSIDHIAQTVLWLGQNVKREWIVSTAKDRERTRLDRDPWSDFARDYLVKVAGWGNRAAIEAKKRARQPN